jgi:hypothetical protein
MVSVVACLVLGLVLVAAATLKLAGGARSRAALASYGVRDPRAAAALWGALIAVELGLGIAVGAGSTLAANAAALLMAGAAAVQVAAILSGRAGAPCGCFGAKGTIGTRSAGRAAALAAALALVPILPREEPSSEGWLAIGLAAALLGLVALAVVVLALAREVGMLRLAVGPQSALEIPEEGPPVGADSGLRPYLDPRADASVLGLAVFTSDGCRLCQTLQPAIAALGRDPHVALILLDEVRDAEHWRRLGVPGSPYALALDAEARVLAKGTFNSLPQLESVLATAERRRREGARA